jgi:hypothetical protein
MLQKVSRTGGMELIGAGESVAHPLTVSRVSVKAIVDLMDFLHLSQNLLVTLLSGSVFLVGLLYDYLLALQATLRPALTGGAAPHEEHSSQQGQQQTAGRQ